MGGTPKLITDEPAEGISYRWPQFLPDSNHFVFFGYSPPVIYLASLNSPGKKKLLEVDSNVAFAAPNFLLGIKSGKVVAYELDLKSFQIKGNEVAVTDDYITFNRGRAYAAFTVSQTGVLAYQADQVPPSPLIWLDRSGKQLASTGEPGYYTSPRLSPDGKKVAVLKHPIHSQEGDVWVYDFQRNNMTRLTLLPPYEFPWRAVWSPDAAQVYFGNDKGVYQVDADGAASPQHIYQTEFDAFPEDVSPNGQYLLVVFEFPETDNDLWLLSLQGERKPVPLLQSMFQEAKPVFSPDGRWIAYFSDESGRWEVYVRPFPNVTSARWQVSAAGGTLPQWRKDGKELFYVSIDNRLMAVDVRLSPVFESGTPRVLFELPEATLEDDFRYDVSADGQRFLVCAPPGIKHFSSITVALNWKAEMKP